MRLLEVKTPEDKKLFLQVAIDIYKDDPNWIRPLDKDIEDVFDPEKNKFIKRGGQYIRWVLMNDSEKPIGRIAAFVNKAYKQVQPTGGIGFFECINKHVAARFMLDASKQWLTELGMEAMDGPINFGERDKWWGLLTEGFSPPLYCMNYNPPYYKDLFEDYGFQLYFNQVCFGLNVEDRLTDRFYERHHMVSQDPNYRVEHFKKSKLEKYAKDFNYVYNKAWAGHGGGKTMEEAQSIRMFKTMKPVIDDRLNWFAYYKDEPVAIYINLPDLNQYFKKMNGAFGIAEKAKLLWATKFVKCDKFVGLVFGVIPEFQGKGVDSYLIVEAADVIQNQMKHYKDYEMQWIGDFNPKMINIAENLCHNRTRNLVTYRYLFDRSLPFERHPVVGSKSSTAGTDGQVVK